MKIKYILIVCGLAGLVVMSGCSKFEVLRGRVSELKEKTSYIEKNMNLPSGIIMDTKTIEDVKKGEVVNLNIIINPSDFVPTIENFSLLTYHHLYAKCDLVKDPETNHWVDGPYDESAYCTLEVVGVVQNEEYEGAYTLAVKVGGEGNFFDDASVYVLYGDKNSKDKTRYVCSNTDATIKVIPTVEEAFSALAPNQSYYAIDQATRAYNGVKTQYFAFWLNRYRDKEAGQRVYDRSLLSVDMVGEDFKACCLYSIDTFPSTGIVEIKLMEDAPHWQAAVKSFEQGTAYVTFPKGSGIVISRSSDDKKTLSLDNARVYGKSIFDVVQKIDLKQLEESREVPFDLSEHAAFAGIDKALKNTANLSFSRDHFVEFKNGILLDYSREDDDYQITAVFYQLDKIKQQGEVSAWYLEDYTYGATQNPDGTFNPASDFREKKTLLSFYVKTIVKLNDQVPIE